MNRIILLVAVCFVGYLGYSQVGIGNTDPKSILDISASNAATPSYTDGILIPRIDNFPSTDPGADQDGMLVFTTGNGSPAKGFYYWDNGSTSWVLVNGGSGADSDWFITGTSNPSTAITDDLVTQGSVTVGTDLNGFPNTKLLVKSDVTSDIYPIRVSPEGTPASSANVFGAYTTDASLTPSAAFNYQALYNNFTSTHTGSTTGLYNNFNASGGAETGVYNRFNGISGIYGMRNEFTGTTSNSASFFGIENRMLSSATYAGPIYGLNNTIQAAGNGLRYGVFNSISGSGTGDKYGSYSSIAASAGGQHYGVYSDAQNATGYAGYFIGRTSFGTDPSTGRYLLPPADGTAGQVLTTDGSGQLGFTDPVSADIDWYEVGTTSAPDAIGDDMFTQGNVVIGATTNPVNVKLYVESDPASNTVGIRQSMTLASSGLVTGIDNFLTASGTASAYGIRNSIGGNSTSQTVYALRNDFGGTAGRKTGMYNSFTFGAGGDVRGVQNEFDNSAITLAFGSYNSFTGLSTTAIGQGTFNTASGSTNAANLYGTRTIFSGPTVSGEAYGDYSFIQTSGTDYGIYAHVDNNAIDYAGYFVGRTSLGTDSAVGRYLMPAADGTAGQVMTTNGSGQLGFTDIPSNDAWYEEGTTNPPNAITDNIFTQGRVGIGDATPEAVLDIEYTGTLNEAVTIDITHGNAGAIGTGLEISARSSDTGGMLGAVINMDGTVGAGAAGVVVNNSSTSGVNSGFYANVTGNTGNEKSGFLSEVTGTGSTNYGIKSYATGATTNWAGYFGDVATGTGNVYVKDLLEVDGNLRYTDGNEAAGRVLASNATGNASWVNPSTVFTDTDDQTIDTFALVGNNLGISLEDDGQPVQTVDLSNLNFNVTNFALAKMTMSANQAITISGVTKVDFDTAAIDLGSNFNTSNDRFEVSEAGVYRITASMHSFSASASTTGVELRIYVNGTLVKSNGANHTGSGIISRQVSTIQALSASQYIEVQVYTIDSFTVNSSDTVTTFEVERIR